MTDLGYISLLLALALALYSIVASVMGARRRYPELVESGRNAVLAVTALMLLATATLMVAFYNNDFQIKYVAQNSNRAMPRYLVVASLWGGQAGSLLWWGTLLSLYAGAVVLLNRNKHRILIPYTVAVLMVTQAFFIAIVAFVANPFERLPFIPADGQGLNPLLRHPAMIGHPPTLYMGFVGFSVPFAFAMAALVTRQLGNEWLHATRRWTLTAWVFLSIGIILGGRWAYDVLGWGGYWGWDPVENSSLLPWLTGTAFLHSVMVQERKGMLKVWNMVLIILTFGLVLFGTFITRSGVISSVHAFAQSAIGPYFLSFIAAIVLGSLGLLFDRLGDLKSQNELDSLLSREALFLLNNLLFVGAMFAVFWGTVFPMISEIIVGNKITVGPPFFNKVAGPIFAALVLVMGVIPLIGWSGATPRKLGRNLIAPAIVTALGLAVLILLGIRQPIALGGFGLCIFSACTTLWEFHRGAAVRRRGRGENYLVALWTLIGKSRRRYGGYLVHLAVILMSVGIVGSTVYQVERTVALSPGESVDIGRYTLVYDNLMFSRGGDKETTAARITVSLGGQNIGMLIPKRDFYPVAQQPMTIPAVRSTLREDLYVILAGWEGDMATLKAYVNPLVIWIWIGSVLFIVGTVVAVWPERRPLPVARRRYAPAVARHETLA